MVRITHKLRSARRISVFMAVICMIISISGCSRNGSPYDPPEPDYTGRTSGQYDRRADDREESGLSNIVMHGPDLPPDGIPYDEWKGIRYTTDTRFPLRSFWALRFGMYGDLLASDYGLYQNPEHIEDAVLEITDVKVEPVGGEMKLRSGGYVDITIEAKWTGTMRYTAESGSENEFYSMLASYRWADNDFLPFDIYTGTSLLNYSDDDDDESIDGISSGEAYDSGFAESDITWNGRTWRLFAKSDKRNASTLNESIDYRGGVMTVINPGIVYTIYTLRVPADYDGAALAVDKDIVDEKWDNIDKYGNFLNTSDPYADILTTDSGVKQSADDYYFIKIQDLVKVFESR